jgi:hypothetical protein
VNETFILDVDADTWARWDAAAERRGISVQALVHEAVEAQLQDRVRRRRKWNGVERRRDRRSLLEATKTGGDDHLPG